MKHMVIYDTCRKTLISFWFFNFMNFEEYRKVRIPTAVDRKNAEILLQKLQFPPISQQFSILALSKKVPQ